MKHNITIGEKYGPAMELTTQDQADAYFKKLVKHAMRQGLNRVEAEKMERSNLGYYAGYYSDKTRERVDRLFNCAHHVFGSTVENGAPTIEEAFTRGVEMGAEARNAALRRR